MDQPTSASDPGFNREPHSSMIVAFKDCDAFGLLYNVRYLDYILDARSEHLLKFYNFDYNKELQRSKETWVIQGHQITYLEPSRVHEPITIRTRIFHFNSNVVRFEGLVLNQDMSRLKALMWTKMSYINLTRGAAIPHPENITNFLSSIRAIDDIPEALDYDARVIQLRSRYQGTKEKQSQ